MERIRNIAGLVPAYKGRSPVFVCKYKALYNTNGGITL